MKFTFQDLPPASAEKFHNLSIERKDLGAKPVVKIWQGKQGKPFAYYAFPSQERREKYIDDQKAAELRRIESREKQKAEKQQANNEMINPFQVGDIVSNSWGWEQTNVDFYQVVAVGPKSIKIRSIGQKTVPGSEYSHGMACNVIPAKDQFLPKSTHEGHYKEGNPPFTKTLRAYLDKAGKVHVYIHWKHGGGGKWEGQPLYNSWYS